MKAYLKSKKQKLVILSVAAAILVGVGINCSKLNRFDFDIGGVNWNQNDTIEFEHIVKKEFYYVQGSGLSSLSKQNFVIKNNTELRTLFNSMDSVESGYAQSTYSFDSTTHQILAVFDEVRNDGVWGIEIANIVERACHIIVTYHTWKKTSTNYGTQSFHAVKIPASDKQIVFQEEFDNEPSNVPYISCSLAVGDTTFLRGTAYLFKDSMPAGQQYKDRIMNIVYYTYNNTNHFYVRYSSNTSYPYNMVIRGVNEYDGRVCNLPDFVKQWNVPPEGKQIYYKGTFIDTGGYHTMADVHGHLILTHLKDTI